MITWDLSLDNTNLNQYKDDIRNEKMSGPRIGIFKLLIQTGLWILRL